MEAQLRARVELARALGDPAEERVAASRLAELLAARDVEIDYAIELAFRALSAHDDPTLRHSLAAWLEGLGEPGLAASELRKLAAKATGAQLAAILVRIGVLHARAGDAVGAQEALLEAAEADAADALPLELLGAVAAWATATHGAGGADLDVEGFPGPRVGAEAYVRAARRRAAARGGDADGEVEDLLRAFELDPSSEVAVTALVGAYLVRDRQDAADQVLVAHAAALRGRRGNGEAAAGEIHARRRAAAIDAGQLGRAIGAALDQRLDTAFEGPAADAFDDMLARAHAYEPLAVRLEVRAEREEGRAAALRWAELGRLLSGPLGAYERTPEILARAVAADASNPENVHELRAIAQRLGAEAWLVEGLIRAAMGADAHGASPEPEPRLAAARELAAIAEERGDILVSAWAYRVLAELDRGDERARAAAGRLEGVVRRHDEELALARQALETSAADGRAVALADVARLARSRPDASRELAEVLLELAELRDRASAGVDDAPVSSRDEDPIFTEALRVAERVGDFAGIARLAKARLEARGPNVRVRGVLVAALRRSADLALSHAAAEAREFADESATRWTCSVAWITAAAAGDAAVRARALAAVAPACGAQIAAHVAAVAAEELEAAGDVEAARRAAEHACRTDPDNVRAVVVLGRLAGDEGPRAQAAVERAMDAAGLSARWCARLSDILERSGDLRGAVAWARRRVALCPGDPAAAQSLVDRAVRAGDVDALAEALAWLAPQPQPSKEMAETLGPALEALAAKDPGRAAVIARRALDVLGPRHPPLRSALEAVADAAHDASLRVVLGERWIAAGAPVKARGPLLLDLATRYAALGDVDAELRALARAADEDVDLGARAARIEELAARPRSADSELAYLQVIAELRLDQGRAAEAAGAFRELGAALWDMADDRPRAVQAWLRAARCDRDGDLGNGYDTLRRDLAAFADTQYAVDCLTELVDREPDKVRSGVIATQAARAALDVGAHTRALGLAKLALERDPGRADALETAEAACATLARVPEMSPIYDQVARRARGRFGRRAAHHRAARFFESGGAAMLALKHAAQAFIAVPSEGTTLGLLQRTAAKAQRAGVAVRTVEHVAELSRGPHARAAWLLRAASMTTPDLDGTRQKMDLLLKATILVPTPGTLSMLAASAREIVTLAPDDGEAVALRLERAGDQLAKVLEGPDGARIAITFVDMAMTLFSDGGWAWRSLHRAAAADADVDEYANLLRFAPALARVEDAAAGLEHLAAELAKPFTNVGHALLRLVGAIARELGDGPTWASALVRAVEKESDDDALVAEADEAASTRGDQALMERLNKRVGVFRRTEALRATAREAITAGEAARAVKALERASEIAAPEQRPDVASELRAALVAAGRGEDAILRELARPDMPKPERALRWGELARIRDEHGDAAGAADALLQAATDEPTFARWTAVEAAADAAGREHVRASALQQLVRLARAGEGSEDVRAILKRLARAEGARGSLAAAETAWREVLEIDPDDAEADVAIEALLVARGSFDDLALHLGERAARLGRSASADDRDKLRAVRLRRAAILEQRLSRLEDACAELEQVLLEHPNHPGALRWLADLYERAGEPHKALPALERLFAGVTEEIEYVTLGVRRARAYVAAGDVRKAAVAVKELHARTPTLLVVAECRVDVARAMEDLVELGDALEALARISVDDPRVRSEMLVEAAQAAARSGDADRSLARAREAARLAPDVPSTQLFARGLEYRVRGSGDRDEALATISSLERIGVEAAPLDRVRGSGDRVPVGRGAARVSAPPPSAAAPLEPEDVALRAFLLAEAEDVVHGAGAGRGEATLRRSLGEIGPQPLVALGLAERAARAGRHEEAYRFYTEAVYGNLLGLRRPGLVAMAAASSASLAGDIASTRRFLDEAAKDPETRTEALRRVASVALSNDDAVRARSVLRGLADGLTGEARAEVLAELARALLASHNPSERLEGDRTMREAIEHAEAGGGAEGEPALARALASRLRRELESFRGRAPSRAAMAAVQGGSSASTSSASVPSPAPSVDAPRRVSTPADEVATRVVEVALAARNARSSAPPPGFGENEIPTRQVSTAALGVASGDEDVSTSRDDPAAPRPRLSVEIPGIPKIPPPPPVLLAEPDEAPPIVSVRHPPLGSEPPPPLDAGSAAAVEPSADVTEIPTTPAGKVAKARARLLNPSGSREEAERLLTEALGEGSIEAADLLDDLMKDEPSRRGALLKVRRQAVELNPGNMERLAKLRDAARTDQNTNYVRAIEHVLAVGGAGPAVTPPPPPLTAQSGQPGMLTLLTRHSHEAEGEALGIVWEGAPAVLAKSPSAVGMTGLERVVPGPTSALSRLYEAALRLLDTPRFALFHKRAGSLARPRPGGEVPFEDEGAPLRIEVALLATPAAILEGDVTEDTADLRWTLGEALSAVLPQNALLLGLGHAGRGAGARQAEEGGSPDRDREARALWNVLLGAFGPPGLVAIDRADAQLADLLWQTLAPRTQRRLKDLLQGTDATPFELVLERARQSGRRVGMFLTGDFAHAARMTLRAFPKTDATQLERPGGLEKLCAELPSLADLLRLAVRPEYADARWHLPTPAAQRLAAGRFPPV